MHYVYYDTYSESCLLSLIQTYSGILTPYSEIFSHTVTSLEPCVTLTDSEPCHIQNPGINRTQDVFRTLSRNIVTLYIYNTIYIFCVWIYVHLNDLGPTATLSISVKLQTLKVAEDCGRITLSKGCWNLL